MAALILPRRFALQQPRQPIGIDYTHPLAQGIQSAWYGNNVFFGPDGTASPTGTSLVTSAYGDGLLFSGTSGEVTLPAGALSNSSTTRFALVKTGNAAFGAVSGMGISGLALRVASGTTLQLVNQNTATILASSAVMSVGQVAAIAGYYSGSGGNKLYLNGAVVASNSTSSSMTGSAPALGNAGNASQWFNGEIYLHLSWSRVLSDAEIADLSVRPYQLFKARPRRIWIGVPAAAGAALASDAQAVSTSTADLTTSITLEATAAATATTTADLTTAVALGADAAGNATATASLTTAIPLAASAVGSATATADLLTSIALRADAAIVATATAALQTSITLAAAAQASATATADLTLPSNLLPNPDFTLTGAPRVRSMTSAKTRMVTGRTRIRTL